MRKPKRSVRQWFVAALTRGERWLELVPRRGCRRVVVTIPRSPDEDIIESETREPHVRLVANIGDQLLVAGPGADEQAVAEVVSVVQSGWNERLLVTIKAGHVESERVQVMTLRGLRRAA